MKVKPIIFNTEMVRAILDGRKTVTRRVIKLKYDNTHIEWKNDKYGKRLIELQNDVEGETHGRNPDGSTWHKLLAYRELKAPYTKGDILYVRETYCWCPCWDCGMDTEEGCCDDIAHKFYNEDRKEYGCYGYKASWADGDEPFERWRPSIHMPKEAARIWLKVTDVRVERLQEIQYQKEEMQREGIETCLKCKFKQTCEDLTTARECFLSTDFRNIWNFNIKKKDLPLYGWEANPWVWVIEFERTVNQNEKKTRL